MRAGIDLGGSKIEVMLLDSEGRIAARSRTRTPRSYTETIDAICALVRSAEFEARCRARCVGVAMPGSISSATGLARNANAVWLNDQPFLADLNSALRRPVRIANDANCFALSEAVDGAAHWGRTVFGVILGTGCGGALVQDGRLIEGASGIAGEWGHMPLPWQSAEEWPGERCWCGRPGCMETWVAGPALTRLSGGSSARMLAAAAMRGEAEALGAFDAWFDRLARGLSVVMGVIDPDVIVFGGGLSNIDLLYPGVAAKLPAYVFSDHVAVKLVRNKHGDSSGVRGAAWLFTEAEAEEAAQAA
jgi:fructokinase